MQPVEQSHLKGSNTSPAISAQLFRPPCPAPEVAQQRISTTDEPVIKMQERGVSRQIVNDNSVGIEKI